MSSETASSINTYNDSCNTAIIVVFVLFSSFCILTNVFAVVSIARHCPISISTLLICFFSAIEMLNAFACGATTLYSYLKTSDNFANSSMLCNFYAWLYVAFRIMATSIVTVLVFDRVLLSFRQAFYVKQWSSFRTSWIVPLSVFIVAVVIASSSFVDSSYTTSPDGGRFHCLFDYSGSFAIFYIVFHVGQLLPSFVMIPWIISREEHVDANLSVLLVGEMAVCRKGNDVVKARDSLKISRLIGAVVVLYYTCSILFPLILLLRFLDVYYPPVAGLLALQLPTYGAMFMPIVYGFTWKPYRRAYYDSLSCICPASKQIRTTRGRSIYNPAFRETREFETNSILHTRGVSLHESTSQFEVSSIVPSSSAPSSSAPSDPIELDSSQLSTHPEPASWRRQPAEILPRAKSFQDHYRYTPSKFQSIFEIIDALSDPRRHSSDTDNDDSQFDSLSSSRPSSPLHLNDVSLQIDAPDVFSGVNFSSVNVSSWPYNNKDKVINKSRLGSQRPNSFNDVVHFGKFVKKEDKDISPTAGPIRFSDLKRTRPEPKHEEIDDEPKIVNEKRFMKYLTNESYVSNKEG